MLLPSRPGRRALAWPPAPPLPPILGPLPPLRTGDNSCRQPGPRPGAARPPPPLPARPSRPLPSRGSSVDWAALYAHLSFAAAPRVEAAEALAHNKWEPTPTTLTQAQLWARIQQDARDVAAAGARRPLCAGGGAGSATPLRVVAAAQISGMRRALPTHCDLSGSAEPSSRCAPGIAFKCTRHKAFFAFTWALLPAEPVLASFAHMTVIMHSSLARSLAFILANKLQSSTLLGTQLTRLFVEAYEASAGGCLHSACTSHGARLRAHVSVVPALHCV